MRKHKLDPTKISENVGAFRQGLESRIKGQPQAIEEVVGVYQTYMAGLMDPSKPIASFLFLGPTGVGKTKLVESIAEVLVGDSRAVVKVDCAEFQHSHEIAKLIGSPPGYLGHRETHPLLSQEVLNQYHTQTLKISFVLLDEIEKASDALWNLLLGVLDRGTLTLGDNRRVDFTRTMIFMTSNLGAKAMGDILQPSLGFAASEIQKERALGQVDGKLAEKLANSGLEAARKRFTPEFMNRIDRTVTFQALGRKELHEILQLELNNVQQRIIGSALGPFILNVTQPAREYLLDRGTDMKYGARALKRMVDKLIVQPLSNLIVTDQALSGDLIQVEYNEEDGLLFSREAEGMTPHQMSAMVVTGKVEESKRKKAA